jgi:hypothetical protein
VPLPRSGRQAIVLMKRETSRRILNHSALEAAIRRNFPTAEILPFGRNEFVRPLVEHSEIFKRARLVVGPHGAGFGNLMFAAAGCGVVEIGFDGCSGMCMDDMYYALSTGLGQRYWLVLGRGSYTGGIQVDVSDVIEVMKAAWVASEPEFGLASITHGVG